MSDTDRRMSDRVWDVGLKIISVLLLAVSSFFFVRLDALEKKAQVLEVKSAVADTQMGQIMTALGEIKNELRAVREEVAQFKLKIRTP